MPNVKCFGAKQHKPDCKWTFVFGLILIKSYNTATATYQSNLVDSFFYIPFTHSLGVIKYDKRCSMCDFSLGLNMIFVLSYEVELCLSYSCFLLGLFCWDKMPAERKFWTFDCMTWTWLKCGIISWVFVCFYHNRSFNHRVLTTKMWRASINTHTIMALPKLQHKMQTYSFLLL